MDVNLNSMVLVTNAVGEVFREQRVVLLLIHLQCQVLL